LKSSVYFILLLAEMWKQFTPFQQPCHLSLLRKTQFLLFLQSAKRLYFCAMGHCCFVMWPSGCDTWHTCLPMPECHILAPSRRNDCVLGTVDWKGLSKSPNI